MSALFEQLAQQLSGPAMDQISQQIGADRGVVEQAVPTALATIMGGLARNTQSPSGAEALLGALTRDHDGSILDSLGGFLGNPQGGPGEAILGHVLGSKRPAVETGLGRSTGLSAGQIGQLMTMLAPLVMGFLGRNQRQTKLDSGGLADLLRGERKGIESMATQGGGVLGNILDSDGDGKIADDVASLGAGLLKSFLKNRR